MSAQARFFGQTLPPPIKKEIKHGALNKQIKHHKKQQDEDKRNNKKIAEDDKYVYYEYHDDEEEDEAIDDGLEEKALVAAAAAAARRRSSTNVATVKPASTAAAAPKDANEAAIEAKNKFLNKMQEARDAYFALAPPMSDESRKEVDEKLAAYRAKKEQRLKERAQRREDLEDLLQKNGAVALYPKLENISMGVGEEAREARALKKKLQELESKNQNLSLKLDQALKQKEIYK